MSKRKNHPSHYNRCQAKQARFQKSNSVIPPRLILGAAIGLIIVLVIVAVYVTSKLSGSQVASKGGIPFIGSLGKDVQISLAQLGSGKAKFYRYLLPNSREVEFFVIKSSDGVYRAAFNACGECFQARKGYRQEGDDMVCNECGQRFSSRHISEVKGGCNPVSLTPIVENDILIVRAHDLETGGSYF